MKYRTIGTDPKTRREVSVLSLGAMRFGTTTDEATSFAAWCGRVSLVRPGKPGAAGEPVRPGEPARPGGPGAAG